MHEYSARELYIVCASVCTRACGHASMHTKHCVPQIPRQNRCLLLQQVITIMSVASGPAKMGVMENAQGKTCYGFSGMTSAGTRETPKRS